MNFWHKLLAFFGIGKSMGKDTNFYELLDAFSSQQRQDLAKQQAFQAIQKGDEIYPDRPHPYEATLRADATQIDTACTKHHTTELKDSFGDAQYLSVLLEAGIHAELAQTSPADLEGKIRSAIAQNQATADSISTSYKEAERDLQIFKGANGLTSTAIYPDKKDALLIIAALAIVEAIFNAFFLRKGINFSMSLLIALSVAIINVGGNVWLGMRYRFKNHIDKQLKHQGELNKIYSFILILAINGLIAIYRFWYANDTNTMSGQFVLETTILFIVGIGMGILAFNKGYSLDDPYPGYGEYARRLKHWADQLSDVRTQHATFCADLKKRADSSLEGLETRILTASESFQNELPAMAQKLKVWEADRGRVNFAYRQLQEIFKIIICANHQSAEKGYPRDLQDLPENQELRSYQSQIDRFMSKKGELQEQVASLRRGVTEQRTCLQQWWHSQSTQELLKFPK